MWERTFFEVAKEYPEITPDYAHVDAITMWMVKNPEWFDVIVTDNMFGDIYYTDLAAKDSRYWESPPVEILIQKVFRCLNPLVVALQIYGAGCY